MPINIGNWTLGILNRTAATYPAMSIRQITNFNGFAAGTVIPPGGYLLLENVAVPRISNSASAPAT